MHAFDKLSDRQRYGSTRRSKLLSKYISEDKKKAEWIYFYEADLDRLLKRKLGYNEWDKNWDVGLHLKEDKVYILLSRKNELGSFSVLERIEYSEDLDSAVWLSDCVNVYLNQFR